MFYLLHNILNFDYRPLWLQHLIFVPFFIYVSNPIPKRSCDQS